MMPQADRREDAESCARLTKMQQPPALEADGFRKFNRSYELNAGKHRLIFQARFLSIRFDRRAGLLSRKATPR
jgi:hypothetical protein